MEEALAVLKMIWNHKDIAIVLVLSLVIGWYKFEADKSSGDAHVAVLARAVAEERLKVAQDSFLAQMKAMDLTMEESNERSEFLAAENKRIEKQRGKDGDGPLAPVLRDTLDVMRGRAAALSLPAHRPQPARVPGAKANPKYEHRNPGGRLGSHTRRVGCLGGMFEKVKSGIWAYRCVMLAQL